MTPERGAVVGGVVGDQLGDAGEQQDVITRLPTTSASAAVAAKTSVSGVAPAPRVRMVSRSTVTRSARWPTAIRPASSKPERAVSVVRRRSEQLERGPVAALLGGQPLVHLHRAHLLEQVDHRMAVGAQREGGAGVVQPPRRTDPVGEVALGGRAEADVGARLAEQPDVVVGQVGRVHGGGQRTERSGLGEQLGRGDARTPRRQASFSATCSERCTCSGLPCGRLDDHLQLVARHRAHRVDRGTDPRVVERSHPLGPGVGVAVGEAHLHALRRPADTRPRGSRCRAAGSGSRPRRRPRAAPCPSRWGRRTASRRAGGAGSGTRRPR